MRLLSAKRTFLLFLILLFGFALTLYLQNPSPPPTPPNILNDASRLNRTVVKEIIRRTDIQGLQQAVRYARDKGLKIAIAGKRHSMGGHAIYKDAVVLDMLPFNKVLFLDRSNQTVTVQSGTTWKEVQEFLNPYGLAVITMQGPNIFTVGGSLSVNAHGWDLRHGPVAETVERFRLLMADGSIRRCSRTENSELFHLVLGGYGLLGVILDVELKITGNFFYKTYDSVMDYRDFPEYFEGKVLSDSANELGYADLSISPGSFLREIVATTYVRGDKSTSHTVPLLEEHHVFRDKLFFALSRKYGWGKRLRWYLQKQLQEHRFEETLMTRNNIMRSPAKRLEYYSPDNTDILQEYFVPKAKFVQFTDGLRNLISGYHANLLNVTVRYIKPNSDAFLNYAGSEAFAFVLYLNVKTSSEGQLQTAQMTGRLIDLATDLGGTFYLPYLLYYDRSQLQRAYPEIDSFFEMKKKYDPKELFMNSFYEKYSGTGQ